MGLDIANKDILDAIQYIMSNMATKDDLKQMATKDDLKQMATKDDLKQMASKDDLKQMETRLNTKIEHDITKRLDALTDGYKSVHEKQWELERQNEQLMAMMNDLRNRVSVLESKTA